MPTASRALLANLTPRGRMVLAGSALALVALVFLGMQIAGRPSYSLIDTGLDPATTGKVTAALDAKGIAYELRNNGTALAVEKSQTAQARIALAGAGLDGGSASQPGFELFDKQKIGSSDFQQKVTYQRALEGQVATTIEQVQGVSGAQVRLVLADDQLFSETSTPATAAVLLSGSSAGLDPGAVRGIAQLVSSSVKGLKPANVSITDGQGELLWPRGDAGAIGGSVSKQAVQSRYEAQVEAGINALLLRTVGPGKAEVQVSADVNADLATKDELTYGRSTPIKQVTESEKLVGGSGSGSGAAGTASNIPSYAAAAAAGGKSNYNRKSTTKDFGVDKTVIRTKVAPGAVNRLNVALVVDKSVPKAEIPAIRAAVAGAAGILPSRGDTLAVSQVAFAKPPKIAAPGVGPAGGMIGYAKYGAAGVGLLGFLFFSARQLRRREGETLMREPNWLREIEAPTTLAHLERPRASALPERSDNPAQMQVEELAEREPERVAQQIRTWMRDA
ncbi:MAG: flagellar M-ring protein FliF [Solirubrobacteraceae bacterium]|jgi:flagellar M-ring protein FliF|nr:flagellar M-ring protein FliF [Solirubrobacteraceae bacterium]